MSDEVYEHVTYDGRAHASVLMQPELAEKAFVVFSFGKTMHATGMRVGYCVAPPELTRELRKVHQFNTFSIAHAQQVAIARYLAEKPDSWRDACRRSFRPSATGCAPRWQSSGLHVAAGPGDLFPAPGLQRIRAAG